MTGGQKTFAAPAFRDGYFFLETGAPIYTRTGRIKEGAARGLCANLWQARMAR